MQGQGHLLDSEHPPSKPASQQASKPASQQASKPTVQGKITMMYVTR